ncbi:NLRC4 [Branchiostoma lanceolatum]|uniref:NLRC4 protein n=1 Tax=Branchiostoma lanceolatum TaxID=7740 RepID=A0A8J9V830_BRALA|nr:NLRC4 [Branchiostoma lanceolatum]
MVSLIFPGLAGIGENSIMATSVEEGGSLSELDIAFRLLVDNIGLNWRTLAPELGLTPGQIGWVTRQCGGNVMKEVFQCLCTWKETFTDQATVQQLVRALHKPKVRLLSRMADEIVKKCPSARNQMLSTLPQPGRKRRDVNKLSVSLPTQKGRSGTGQSSKGSSNGSKVAPTLNAKFSLKHMPAQKSVKRKTPFPDGGEGAKKWHVSAEKWDVGAEKWHVEGNIVKSCTQSSLTASLGRPEGKSPDLTSKVQSSGITGNSRQKSNSFGNTTTSLRAEIKKSESSSSLPKPATQKGLEVRRASGSTSKHSSNSNGSLRPRRECTMVKKEDAQKAGASKTSEGKDDTSAKEDSVKDNSGEVVAEIMILDEKTGRLVLGKKKPGQQGTVVSQPVAAEQESVRVGENIDFYMREVVTEIKKTYRKLFCVPEVFLFGSLVRLNVQHVYTQLQMVDRDTQTPVEDIGSIITPQAQTVRAGTVMLVTPRRILIEGEQGIGKSTFCHKICYNWGCTLFNVYVQFSLVFKIDLSSVRADIISTICHQLLEADSKMKRSDMRAYIEKRQHETLFILDGLDQLPTHAHPEYLALMRKEILPKACVIVTTRPLEQLLCEFDSYYVMKGFTPEKRKEYVRRHLGRLSLKFFSSRHGFFRRVSTRRPACSAGLQCGSSHTRDVFASAGGREKMAPGPQTLAIPLRIARGRGRTHMAQAMRRHLAVFRRSSAREKKSRLVTSYWPSLRPEAFAGVQKISDSSKLRTTSTASSRSERDAAIRLRPWETSVLRDSGSWRRRCVAVLIEQPRLQRFFGVFDIRAPPHRLQQAELSRSFATSIPTTISSCQRSGQGRTSGQRLLDLNRGFCTTGVWPTSEQGALRSCSRRLWLVIGQLDNLAASATNPCHLTQSWHHRFIEVKGLQRWSSSRILQLLRLDCGHLRTGPSPMYDLIDYHTLTACKGYASCYFNLPRSTAGGADYFSRRPTTGGTVCCTCISRCSTSGAASISMWPAAVVAVIFGRCRA